MARRLTGINADYFQVVQENGEWCGHPHQTIADAVHCMENCGSNDIVAIKKRTDAIGTYRLYNNDCEYLSERDIQALMDFNRKQL